MSIMLRPGGRPAGKLGINPGLEVRVGGDTARGGDTSPSSSSSPSSAAMLSSTDGGGGW